MPEQTPQLVIEVYTDDEGPSRIIIRTNADAATTIAPASVSAAVPAAAPAAPKKRARRKAAVGKSRVVQEAQPADGEDQDATEVVTKAAPANGRRKKKAEEESCNEEESNEEARAAASP